MGDLFDELQSQQALKAAAAKEESDAQARHLELLERYYRLWTAATIAVEHLVNELRLPPNVRIERIIYRPARGSIRTLSGKEGPPEIVSQDFLGEGWSTDAKSNQDSGHAVTREGKFADFRRGSMFQVENPDSIYKGPAFSNILRERRNQLLNLIDSYAIPSSLFHHL